MSNRFSVISRGFHLTYGYDVFHSVGDGVPDVLIFSEPSPIGADIIRPILCSFSVGDGVPDVLIFSEPSPVGADIIRPIMCSFSVGDGVPDVP